MRGMASAVGASVLSLGLLAGVASAAPVVTINTVTGAWGPITGGTNVTGVGSNEVRWGIPANSGGQKSGYGFRTGNAPSGPHNTDTEFNLRNLHALQLSYQCGYFDNRGSVEDYVRRDVQFGRVAQRGVYPGVVHL